MHWCARPHRPRLSTLVATQQGAGRAPEGRGAASLDVTQAPVRRRARGNRICHPLPCHANQWVTADCAEDVTSGRIGATGSGRRRRAGMQRASPGSAQSAGVRRAPARPTRAAHPPPRGDPGGAARRMPLRKSAAELVWGFTASASWRTARSPARYPSRILGLG